VKLTAVIGANYGDEGKGLLTDYLCAGQPGSLVIRHNGGAQAGHTVVTPEGKRHIFSHFGAGTFAGAPTYLSRFFLVNPLVWMREGLELEAHDIIVHPEAPVTTPWDILYNRALEESRACRHGSCGLGIWETELRHRRGLETRVKHMGGALWKARLSATRDYFRDRYPDIDAAQGWAVDRLFADFGLACEAFRLLATVRDTLPPAENIVFEGAQGLLLDEHNRENFPHVSGSRTGLDNVEMLCREFGLWFPDVEPIYVTRSYLTRHGAGPLPGEDTMLSYPDDTNQFNPWQQYLRFAPLDVEALKRRIRTDCGSLTPSLAVTHLDQHPFPFDPLPAFNGFYMFGSPVRPATAMVTA
jgi:adenylosuccinate synthase